MTIFYVAIKSGTALITDTTLEYCKKNRLTHTINNDGPFYENPRLFDCFITGPDHHYAFSEGISKDVAVFRDPRDQVISAHNYFNNFPADSVEYFKQPSQQYRYLTVKECINKGLSDHKFWFYELYNTFAWMYNNLISADENLLCVRLENLCDPRCYKQQWKQIADWIQWPGFEISAQKHSPCDSKFVTSDHVISNGLPNLWHTQMDQFTVEFINSKLPKYLALLERRCPLYK